MTPEQEVSVYNLIVAILKTDGGQSSCRLGDYRFGISLNVGDLHVVMTRSYRHPDGRMHRTSKDKRWDVTDNTATSFFFWLMSAIVELEELP